MSHRTPAPILLLLGLVGGCFSPEVLDSVETDGAAEGGASETSPTSGGTTSTDDPTEGASTDSPTTSSDPTTGPDPTVGETESETGFGGDCTDSSECAVGVCVDTECVPCGEAPEPDAACAEADSNTAVCAADGTCVACTPDSCGGSTPACDPEVGCVACTEHAQCPDSACHLGGPDLGSCFDVNDVVEVSDAAEAEAALAQAEPDGQLVMRLTPHEFNFTTILNYQAGVSPTEVALIGPGASITVGIRHPILAPPLLYVSGISFEGGPQNLIEGDSASEVWLDDVSINSFLASPLLIGTANLRRSQIRGPVGVFLDHLVAENSSFGPGGDPVITTTESIDLRYVSIVDVATLFDCNGSTGVVRNSILLAGDGVSQCGGVVFSNNASNLRSVGGTIVPIYDPDWFVVSSGSRFFLSESGQEVFDGIADWDEGDPLFDIEGDPRPTDFPGYPGVDEP